jgi:hypothetical protein
MCRRGITATLAALLALSVMGFAGPQRGQNDKRTGKSTARPGRTNEGEPATSKAIDHAEIRGGEIRRTVLGDESITVHMGMTPSGATVVEFPARDRYFAVSTSDIGDWVRVEKSPTSSIDSHIVLRPGKDLVPGDFPAIVQVQMRTGAMVTLCIHAVRSAAQHTNRVVIVYNRDAVVTARTKSGLAVNLGEEIGPRFGDGVPAQQVAAVEEKPPAPAPVNQTSDAEPAGEGKGKEKGVDPKTIEALKEALKDVMANPGSFKGWRGPTHGLSVAAKLRSLDERASVALVAVKNVEDAPIQVLTGQPELVIETVNKGGKVIQLQPVEKLSEEASTTSNIIPGRATVYYAVAFASPILGKQQRLRVTVGRRDVADDPAGANLTADGAVSPDSGVDKARRAAKSLRVVPSDYNAGSQTPDAAQAAGDSVLKSQPPAETGLRPQPAKESSMKKIDLVDTIGAALAQALKTADGFMNWSEEAHGLSISALPVRDLDGRYQVAVFAVRNNKKRAAKLVPGQPEINIENLNDKGRPLTVETVKKLGERTTAVGDVIPGRAVEYYAVAFAPQSLGFRQRLRVAVGTTTAADEPAKGVLIR